ncbi:DEAD/DEAH box helicase [Amycolatopsis minnesotensis]|uniref:Helicase ATP-binding domain-containing protein n=1 Tax=Amycolatopsis minnesotensis TaxID=337894 RepID=A0ABN2SAN4_9PSEU
MTTEVAALRRHANGTVRHIPATTGHRGGWLVDAAPHVAVRMKRCLPRIQQSRSGTITLLDTPEMAADLDWLLSRWPMRIDPAAEEHLRAQAERHRGTQDAVLQILAGRRMNTGARTPAREPYPEQRQAADLVIATGRALIGDEVGLGKSFAGLLVLSAADALPAVVVTLTHLPRQWIVKELAAAFPELRGHIITTGTVYDPGDVDVLAISYSKLAAWADYLAGTVKTVIFDEIQELRHHNTAKYTAAGRIADSATYRVGLSATPVFNWGGEAYNILDLLAPDSLGSREEFLREWGTDLGGGKVATRDPKALGEHLRGEGLLIARTRADVGRPLPQPILAEQNVDGDPEVYRRLAGDAAALARFVLDKTMPSKDRWQAAGQMDLALRQATGIAKAPAVAAFCELLLHTTERIVLWGWHRAVYQVWLDALADYHPVLYTGSETPARKQKSVEAFLDGDARVLIMSLRSGAGLDGLQMGCDTGVFGELDWSPQVHLQCVGRLRRDGITDQPKAYFCLSDQGSDPPMRDLLDVKRMQNDPMLHPRAATVEPAASGLNHIRALAESVLARTTTSKAS